MAKELTALQKLIKQKIEQKDRPKGGDLDDRPILSLYQRTEPGDTSEVTVRFLPDPDQIDPFRKYALHYRIGADGNQKTLMCPKKNFGETCEVCNYASKLWDKVDEITEKRGLKAAQRKKLAEYKQALDMGAKDRFFARLVVRGEEERGAQWFSMNKSNYFELIEYIIDDDYGDFTCIDLDTTTGRDFKIKYTRPANIGPGSYPETTFTIRPKASPLAETQEEVDKIMDSLPDFSVVHERSTPEEVEDALMAHLGSLLGGPRSEVQAEMEKAAEAIREDEESYGNADDLDSRLAAYTAGS